MKISIHLYSKNQCSGKQSYNVWSQCVCVCVCGIGTTKEDDTPSCCFHRFSMKRMSCFPCCLNCTHTKDSTLSWLTWSGTTGAHCYLRFLPPTPSPPAGKDNMSDIPVMNHLRTTRCQLTTKSPWRKRKDHHRCQKCAFKSFSSSDTMSTTRCVRRVETRGTRRTNQTRLACKTPAWGYIFITAQNDPLLTSVQAVAGMMERHEWTSAQRGTAV